MTDKQDAKHERYIAKLKTLEGQQADEDRVYVVIKGCEHARFSDTCPACDDQRTLSVLRSTIQSLRRRTDVLEAVISAFVDCVDPPEPACACHLAPPCADCVEYSTQREALEMADEVLKGKV